MPQVHHVKKARKANRNLGIKKGESYYWWKFRNGGKRISKTPPKPSQLTQSEFWSTIFGLQETSENAPAYDDIEGEIDTIKDELENIKSEIEDKISNMEQTFPNGCPSLDTLNERKDALEGAIDELGSIDTSFDPGNEDDEDYDEDQAKSDRAEEIWGEVTDALGNISCS